MWSLLLKILCGIVVIYLFYRFLGLFLYDNPKDILLEKLKKRRKNESE